MPVIAKTEKLYLSSPEDLISRHHVSGFNPNPSLPPTVLLNGNTLDHSLLIFRAHHRHCAERRKHGLSYELQVEAFKTGKYLEKLDCSTNAKHTHSTSKGPDKHAQTDQETTCGLSGTKTEPMDTHSFKQSPLTSLTVPNHPYQPAQDLSTDSKPDLKSYSSQSYNTHSVHPKPSTMLYGMNRSENQHLQQNKSINQTNVEAESRVSIKTEPSSGESTPQRCTRSPVDTCPKPKTNGVGPPKTKRRRYSIPTTLSSVTPRSSSYSDDAGDDLSLSAEDCISGVISTPPIKPLEEGDSVITTPSPTTNPPLVGSKTSNTSNNTRTDVETAYVKSGSLATTTVTPAPTANGASNVAHIKTQSQSESISKNFSTKGDSLYQDLNDFTKVMEMVTKEQLAIERQATLSTVQQQNRVHTDTSQRRSPPKRMMSPPPYYPPGAQPPTTGPPQVPRHLPISQSSYSVQQPFKYPLTPVPRKASVQDGLTENRQLARPHSLVDMQIQKHPRSLNLSGVSPQMERPQLMSPTLISTPQTPITTPGYPDRCPPDHTPMNSQPPHTPTTPLEHLSAFQLPPTQQLVQSPTQSRQFFPQSVSSISSYQYSQKHHLSSSAGLPNSIANNWPQTHSQLSSPQSSLNETLLARVNSQLEVITRQKRPPGGQDWIGQPSEMQSSLTLPQLGSQYSAVGTTMSRDTNPTGLPPPPLLSSTLTYHSLPHPYNHHPM